MSEKGLASQVILLLNEVFSKYLNITKAVLFESRAKGVAWEGSDIDIAIFGIDDELKVEEIAIEIDQLPVPYKFDVKAYDEIRNLDLREHIDRVGIVFYERNNK
ncbi:MAG: nucleotidyltransferase domain-containing protein [Ruminiclostridium sp.]